MNDNNNTPAETPKAEDIQPSEPTVEENTPTTETPVEENTPTTETATEEDTEETPEEKTEVKTEEKPEETKEEPKKETPKESLFYTFDDHKKRASNHEKYSTDLFLEYQEWFNKDKKNTIKAFRKLYEDNNNDIQILDDSEDKDKKVIIDFLDWSAKLPKHGVWWFRFWHWVKGLFTNKSRTKIKIADETKKAPKNLTQEDAYLKDRYYVAQKFYSKRADEGKKYFFRSQKTILILSVIIPILALVPQLIVAIIEAINSIRSDTSIIWECPRYVMVVTSIITAILSAIIAYLTSSDKLYSWLKHWTKNRDLSERLKKEYALYQGRSGEYANVKGNEIDGHKPAERKFRENVEAIIEDGREILNTYGNKKPENNS